MTLGMVCGSGIARSKSCGAGCTSRRRDEFAGGTGHVNAVYALKSAFRHEMVTKA